MSFDLTVVRDITSGAEVRQCHEANTSPEGDDLADGSQNLHPASWRGPRFIVFLREVSRESVLDERLLPVDDEAPRAHRCPLPKHATGNWLNALSTMPYPCVQSHRGAAERERALMEAEPDPFEDPPVHELLGVAQVVVLLSCMNNEE